MAENIYNEQNMNNSHTNNNIPSWDSLKWLQAFEIAKQRRQTQPNRKEVFTHTIEVTKRGQYVSESGTIVSLDLNPDAVRDNVFYESPVTVQHPERKYANSVDIVNKDCLLLAKELLLQDSSDDLCVLNMANAFNPGGGVYNGAGAQEEYLFRCSDYYRFLYQYATDFDCRLYDIEPNSRHHYPFKGDNGGVFSHGVTIFRTTEAEGYALVEKPWKVNFVAVAAHHLPYRCYTIPSNMVASTLERIRTILRIAYNNGQRRLVLGAFGCGAFNNPPMHMAKLFKQVFQEDEFKGLFRNIYFAIIEDHNSNNANYNGFLEVFDKEEDRDKIISLLFQTCRDGIEKIVKTLDDKKFFIVPASIIHQNPERGGLARHSLMVCEEALSLWEQSPSKDSIDRNSVIIASLLHDLCKTDVYYEDPSQKTGFKKRNPRFPVGHGERSIMMALMSGFVMKEEECIAIRWHMGCHEIIEYDKKGRHTEEYLNYDLGTNPKYHPLTEIIQKADGIATQKALTTLTTK